MSPVHVIVGDDVRAETMWSSAFTGAVDLYRFERNVDAFERLTAAQAPIDLVVLTPAQRGPFNLTPDQFVARVLEGPLGASRFLTNLHVIVVGQSLQRQHPRAMAVSTLDAAIRLVKFGEVEQAPMPTSATPLASATAEPASRRPRVEAHDDLFDDLQFSGSIISRIWDAGRDERPATRPASPITPIADATTAAAPADAGGRPDDDAEAVNVLGGGPGSRGEQAVPAVPQRIDAPNGPAQLFSRSVPNGSVTAGGGASAQQPTPPADAVQMVGAPGEAIEVASGTLQPSRPYQLPGGGTYRGPAMRGGSIVHAAGHHDVGGQPVPPALADQVHSMVYGGMQVGNPHDPLLVWSSSARANAGDPAVMGAPVDAVLAPTPGSIPQQPSLPSVPLEPPAGAYGGAPAPGMSQAAHADPFLQRAESDGGAVSFG